MGWSQPCAWAIAAFLSLLTVPITVAPRCFAHWHMMRPTPPAAAWIKIVSPGRTLYVSCRRQRCRHAADHHRRGGALIDAGGQGDDARRRDDAEFGVRAFRHAGVGDAVADRKAAHVGS